MIYRPARETDFPHLETFVWQAIFPAFDHPGLTDAQRQENDALVETARAEVLAALGERNTAVFVAIAPSTRALVGYLIADGTPRAYAEIRRIILKRSFWGKGVASRLLAEATNFIGPERAVAVAVRHYNERALAFFAKHGFVNTGETTGNFAISRTLLLREALEDSPPIVEEKSIPAPPTSRWEDDFPTGADEPVFESLPDYNLRVEETPLFVPGSNALSSANVEELGHEETTLSEDQLSELEAFIARARAQKGAPAPEEKTKPVPPARPQSAGSEQKTNVELPTGKHSGARQSSSPQRAGYNRRNITFEVDFGEGPVKQLVDQEPSPTHAAEPGSDQRAPTVQPSFEFAFGPEANSIEPAPERPMTVHRTRAAQPALKNTVSPSQEPGSTEKDTKQCPDCQHTLPAVARFCFSCGFPQPEVEPATTLGTKAPEEESLVLEELPDLPKVTSERISDFLSKSYADKDKKPVTEPAVRAAEDPEDSVNPPGGQTSKSAANSSKTYTLSELKLAFREHLQERLIAYFGERKLKGFIRRLEESSTFQTLRDGSLTNLLNWLNAGVSRAAAKRRIFNTLADLTEYFVVETAGDLSDNVLPQRLLRHQSIDWETADIFKVVMDYLDFDNETEQVYTDFVTMPARALRNATKSFLQAKKDERIFFICDQSLISQAKNGFAVTDAGLYWKNVLQPAGAVTFTTLDRVKIEQGHLQLDGQFFNAGGRLNVKMAVLLDKLRRM